MVMLLIGLGEWYSMGLHVISTVVGKFISLGINDCKYGHLRHDGNIVHTLAMMPNFAIV